MPGSAQGQTNVFARWPIPTTCRCGCTRKIILFGATSLLRERYETGERIRRSGPIISSFFTLVAPCQFLVTDPVLAVIRADVYASLRLG
jgi:hypothetical protein